jgi:hypothetical protein
MPTQSTQPAPGHHWLSAELAPSVVFTVHSQVTFVAPTSRNTCTTCRHAATNEAGDARPAPHEYQSPFISCPNDRITG